MALVLLGDMVVGGTFGRKFVVECGGCIEVDKSFDFEIDKVVVGLIANGHTVAGGEVDADGREIHVDGGEVDTDGGEVACMDVSYFADCI